MPDQPQRIVIIVDDGDVQEIICEGAPGEPFPSFLILGGTGMADCAVLHDPLFVADAFARCEPSDVAGMTSELIIPGRCTRCGCTEERACQGGCYWVDPDRTLCSRCAGDTYGPQSVEQMQPVLDQARKEMLVAIAANQRIRFELGPHEAMTILGHLQLAARHPKSVGPATRLVREIASTLQEEIGAIGPALKQLAAAGWDTAFDGIDVMFSEEDPT